MEIKDVFKTFSTILLDKSSKDMIMFQKQLVLMLTQKVAKSYISSLSNE